MSEGTEKPDVVEVSDEVVRTSRYGQRNYRNSIGLDNRRHWHGGFVVEEVDEDVELEPDETDEEVQDVTYPLHGEDTDARPFHEIMPEDVSLAEAPTEKADEEDFEDEEVDTGTDDDERAIASVDDSANIADTPQGTFEDDQQEPTNEELDNFFDPLKEVEGLEDVVSEPEESEEANEDAVVEETEELSATDETKDLTDAEGSDDADEYTDSVSERD